MDKENVVHIYNGISAIKRNETLNHATTKMNLENIRLRQTQKTIYYMIQLI